MNLGATPGFLVQNGVYMDIYIYIYVYIYTCVAHYLTVV